MFSSLNRKYKSHISQNTQQSINEIKNQSKSAIIYHNQTEHHYYYYSYQLRNHPLTVISRCPSLIELEENKKTDNIIVVANTCPETNE